MNKRYIKILVIILGITAAVLIFYFLFFFDFNKQENSNNNTEQVKVEEKNSSLPTIDNPPSVQEETTKPVIEKRELDEMDLAKIASSFAERFGSYSNHSNFGNIRDLKIFMTKNMQAWADNFIAEQSKDSYASAYYGITTKSISTEVGSFDQSSGTASILVKTQRRESKDTISNSVTIYQDIIINFIKENGSWKVDSANWLN